MKTRCGCCDALGQGFVVGEQLRASIWVTV